MTDTTVAGATNTPAAGRLTGPEHYREGQQLLVQAAREFARPDGDPTHALAAAQAHFTAALVAVQAAQLADRYVGDGDHINHWLHATGWFPGRQTEDGRP